MAPSSARSSMTDAFDLLGTDWAHLGRAARADPVRRHPFAWESLLQVDETGVM